MCARSDNQKSEIESKLDYDEIAFRQIGFACLAISKNRRTNRTTMTRHNVMKRIATWGNSFLFPSTSFRRTILSRYLGRPTLYATRRRSSLGPDVRSLLPRPIGLARDHSKKSCGSRGLQRDHASLICTVISGTGLENLTYPARSRNNGELDNTRRSSDNTLAAIGHTASARETHAPS